jgi:hypothetical protein
LAAAAPGSAHGDPPGHYLETENLYPGFSDRPSAKLELALLGHLEAVEQRGYPIKVALVAGRDDLSEQVGLLRRPQRYAELVASQLELDTPVVVVTPHGLGIDPPRQAGGDDLARTAIAAVRRLAAEAGRPLPARVPPAAALRVSAPARTDDDGGVNVALLVGLFAIVFVPSVLLFEVWTRARRRR